MLAQPSRFLNGVFQNSFGAGGKLGLGKRRVCSLAAGKAFNHSLHASHLKAEFTQYSAGDSSIF